MRPASPIVRRVRFVPIGLLMAGLALGCVGGAAPASVRDPAQYVGRWKSGCFAHQWLRVGSLDGPAVMVRAEFIAAQAGDAAVELDLTQQYFDAGDLACSGRVRGIERSEVRFDIDARPTTVDYQGQTLPAARMVAHYAPPQSRAAGLPARIDGLAYPDGYFTHARARRYLLLVIGDGMYFGDEERERDAEGYPLFLEDEAGVVRF